MVQRWIFFRSIWSLNWFRTSSLIETVWVYSKNSKLVAQIENIMFSAPAIFNLKQKLHHFWFAFSLVILAGVVSFTAKYQGSFSKWNDPYQLYLIIVIVGSLYGVMMSGR